MIIRLYTDEDLSGVEQLYAERGLAFEAELFAWKKRAPRSGSWVGTEDDRIVAHYSILELPFHPHERTGFAVDAITAPSHGQIGYIKAMIDEGAGWSRAQGIDRLIGFANEKMAPVKRFLGWQPAAAYRWTESAGKAAPEEAGAQGSPSIGSLSSAYSRTEEAPGGPSAQMLGCGAAESEAPAPPCPQPEGAYARWRWADCPRVYLTPEPAARFSALRLPGRGDAAAADQAPPALVWHRAGEWERLHAAYAFLYLRRVPGQGEGRDMGQQASKAQSPPKPPVRTVTPLHLTLRDGTAAEPWPEIWPLETVEGVTLGW